MTMYTVNLLVKGRQRILDKESMTMGHGARSEYKTYIPLYNCIRMLVNQEIIRLLEIDCLCKYLSEYTVLPSDNAEHHQFEGIIDLESEKDDLDYTVEIQLYSLLLYQFEDCKHDSTCLSKQLERAELLELK